MKVRRKHDLDTWVAGELGLNVKEVRAITRAFLEHLMACLTDLDEVSLAEFGRFRTVIEKAPKKPFELVHVSRRGARKKKQKKRISIQKKVRVHFSKALAFKRMMQARHGPNEENKS